MEGTCFVKDSSLYVFVYSLEQLKGDSAHVSVCLCVSVVSVCLYIC